jgi:hypothetical protein
MAFRPFTEDDLRVFAISGFEERMAAMRSRVRPKLVALGEELAPRLASETGLAFHPHTASHARRRVNPPDETWVALGPSPRGYKRYGHLAAGVGASGPWVRFVVKPECDARPAYAAALPGVPIPAGYEARGDPARLRLRSGEYAVHRGLEVGASARDFLDALLPLVPFYRALEGRGAAGG